MIVFRKREIEVTLLFSYLLKTMPYYTVPEGYDLDNYTHFESSERIAELYRAQTEEIIKRY